MKKPIRFEIVCVTREGFLRKRKSTARHDLGRRIALQDAKDRSLRVVEAIVHVTGTPAFWAETANFFADHGVPVRLKLDRWYREIRMSSTTGEIL